MEQSNSKPNLEINTKEELLSEMSPKDFATQIEQARKKGLPVIFYTWFGSGTPVTQGWGNQEGRIELYKKGISLSEEREIRKTDEFKNSQAALKCGPCYKVIRDLNAAGGATLNSEHGGPRGALIYMVAWASPADIDTAKGKWLKNYVRNGPKDKVPLIWYQDLLDAKIAKLPEDELCAKELNRHLDRASGGGKHHISAVITGKEILALLLRKDFGGVTADTTVLPAMIGGEYNSRNEGVQGHRIEWPMERKQDEWTTEHLSQWQGWSVLDVDKTCQVSTQAISDGLNELFKKTDAMGPTQNRNTGGVVYEGQPRDVSQRTGYMKVTNLAPFGDTERSIESVITYDFKDKYGKFVIETADLVGTRLPYADLIDVFFNYTPFSKTKYADLALWVFLTGMQGMREGQNENLLAYNAFRGPATLSAAMTEYVMSQEGASVRFSLEDYGRLLIKTGEIVDVDYQTLVPILGYGESRNPTPDEIKNGANRTDIIGVDGYMVLEQLSLVKIWSGSWKAPTEYAVAVTPRQAPLSAWRE